MQHNVIDFPTLTVACQTCAWAVGCVGAGKQQCAAEAVDLRYSVPVKKNAHVFRQGDPLDYLYMMRSGSAKSSFVTADGLEQIVAFHYPGDLLGFDAIADGVHETSVIALETMALCRVPFHSLGDRSRPFAPIWTEIMRSGARQIKGNNDYALLLGQKSAAARIATLLLDLSDRFASRGCSRVDFNLTMARQDIANYLSLAVETVSRLFAELQANGIIEVDRRYVRIKSMEKLRRLAFDSADMSRHAAQA